jgi:hypothetical protein
MKTKKLTIYDIKRLTSGTSPYFFSRQSMKFFKQRMSDFHVIKQEDGRYYIYALSEGHKTERWFNPVNNELEHI